MLTAQPRLWRLRVGYQWHTFYGSETNDFGLGIAVDNNGDVYITGSSGFSWDGPAGQVPLNAFSGDLDIFVLKLDTAGAYQWHTFYGYDAIGTGIATSSNGGVYISGYSRSSWDGPIGQRPLHDYNESFDIVMLKLDAAGAYQWHTFYGSTSADYGFGLVVDNNSGVYITGSSASSWDGPAGQAPLHAFLGSTDLFSLKLDAAGAYQWHTFYGYDAAGTGIVVDGNGVVYISGTSNGLWLGPTGQGPLHDYSGLQDIVVLELDPAGAYQWHTFYGAPYMTRFMGSRWMAVVGYNYWPQSVFMERSCWSGTTACLQWRLLISLCSSLIQFGAYQWHTFYGSTSTDTGYGIAVDNNRGVYITGHYGVNDGIVVYKFDTAGANQWVDTYGMGCYNEGNGIVVDNSGQVYSTGYSQCSWNGPWGQAPKHAYIGHDIYVLNSKIFLEL